MYVYKYTGDGRGLGRPAGRVGQFGSGWVESGQFYLPPEVILYLHLDRIPCSLKCVYSLISRSQRSSRSVESLELLKQGKRQFFDM